MKLAKQLNLAFATLLIILLIVTGIISYNALLRVLVREQQNELRQKGSFWLSQISNQEQIQLQDWQSISGLSIRSSKLDIIVYQQDKGVIYTTLPPQIVTSWLKKLTDPHARRNGLWPGTDEDFVVEVLPLDWQQTNYIVTLAAPLRGLKSLQFLLTKQLLGILAFGGAVSILLSYLITRHLVTPLTKLQHELTKVKQLRFSEVEQIAAGGEIGEVAQAVHQLAHELGHYVNTQKLFFQNASHELKTPLMSIQGYAEGIRDGVFTGPAVEQGLNIIIAESARLKKIVNEIILLAKLESEKDIFDLAATDVNWVIAQALERLAPLSQEKGINITIQTPAELANQPLLVWADSEKLLQALINILSNALRYAQNSITLKASLQAEQPVVEITDDGPGIPAALLPQLFHRFVRGKDGETGLGLAISRAIIEKCGGRIEAENLPAGGALFRLYLAPKPSDAPTGRT